MSFILSHPSVFVQSLMGHCFHTASIIAMLVVGFVLFFVFGAWDFRYAKRPVIALRFVKNRSVLGAAWIGFFDFVSASSFFTFFLCLMPNAFDRSRFTSAIPIFGLSSLLSSLGKFFHFVSVHHIISWATSHGLQVPRQCQLLYLYSDSRIDYLRYHGRLVHAIRSTLQGL